MSRVALGVMLGLAVAAAQATPDAVPLSRPLRAVLNFEAGSLEKDGARDLRAVQVRGNLAVGTWPDAADKTIVEMFIAFVKLKHGAGTGPFDVWYRYEPAVPDKFLEQGDHHMPSRPFTVDIP